MSEEPAARLRPGDSELPTTIVLCGELDAVRADGVKAVVDEALEVRPEVLRFEMANLSFMDSSGLAVLVHAANNVDRVILERPSDLVCRVIEVTGLAELFEVER